MIITGGASAEQLCWSEPWMRFSARARHYDWAMPEVASDDTPGGQPDGHSMLLARRHRYTGTLSYYRGWTPGPVPLSRLIAIAVARWRIEEDHQLTKQSTGLDVLAPLDRDLPAGLYLPRHCRGSATPARGRLRLGRRADPDHRAGAAAASA